MHTRKIISWLLPCYGSGGGGRGGLGWKGVESEWGKCLSQAPGYVGVCRSLGLGPNCSSLQNTVTHLLSTKSGVGATPPGPTRPSLAASCGQA